MAEGTQTEFPIRVRRGWSSDSTLRDRAALKEKLQRGAGASLSSSERVDHGPPPVRSVHASRHLPRCGKDGLNLYSLGPEQYEAALAEPLALVAPVHI